MRLAIYARVSTADRDQNPETQLRALREHVAGLADVEIVGEFVDRASADDLRGRRQWRDLLDLAMKRKVDLVLVWKLDRAFRSVVDGATTLQTLRSCGCGIRSLQEPWIDTTTPIGEAMYHITIAWAQLEKRQITERVKAGMDRARAEGTPIGTIPFYGSQATLAGDVTGDGKTDLIAVNGGSIYVMLSNGHGFYEQEWSTIPFSGSKATLAGDVTGDGKTDLIAVNGG